MRKALLPAALALALLACSTVPVPLLFRAASPSPSETRGPRRTRTPRPTRTPRDTPLPSPTATTLPTDTPAAPPSLTATVGPVPPTVAPASPAPSPRPPAEYDCKLIWQSPPNGANYDTEDKFTVGWNIQNIGTATWEPDALALVHVAGARMSPTELVHLPVSVSPGASVVVSVPIRAPKRPDVYTTHWGLLGGTVAFCRLTLTIQVLEP